MKKFGFATVIASGLVAAILGFSTGTGRPDGSRQRSGHHQPTAG